jgi:hypothetical protein
VLYTALPARFTDKGKRTDSFGKLQIAEAQWAKNQISEVMDSATPVLAGATCTPMSFEADTAIGFVDGFQEGASSWTFTHA